MPKRPRSDDLLPSHPGEPYAYQTTPARIEEKDLQGSIPVGVITKEDFAAGLKPIEIVGALPGLPSANYPQGAVVFLTTDNKLYRSTGSTWTVAVPAPDVSGQLVFDQVSREITVRAGNFFSEVFKQTLAAAGWDNSGGGSAVETLVTSNGLSTVGPNVFQAAGYMWRVFPYSLPFNPSKLYRLRTRYRQTVDSAPNNLIYMGFQTFRADGSAANNNGGYAYVQIGGDASTVAEGWVERTSWVKGATLPYSSGSPGFSLDPKAPVALNVDAVWVRPMISCQYSGGSGTTQFDYFQIDEIDEDASTRVYLGLNVDGVVAADKVVANSILAGAITAAKLAATIVMTTLLQVDDTQGSPKTRVKLGKVGAGSTDYGLEVWDQNAETVMDFTGAKRILAVPVQNWGDSGGGGTLDLSTGLTQQVRLTGTATITLTNPTNGGRYRIWFQQDATGSRPFPTMLGPNGEVFMYTNDTPPTLTATPGALDLFEFEYRTSPTSRFTCMTLQTNVLVPSPRVAGSTATNAASGTSVGLNMPGGIVAGELLLAFVAHSAGSSASASGWTTIDSTGGYTVFAKVAAGSDTITVSFSPASVSQSIVARVNRWFGSLSGVEMTKTNGVSTTPNPPSITPSWAVDRTLFLASFGAPIQNSGAVTVPANYTLERTSADASNGSLSVAKRNLYATSEDPGTFTCNNVAWESRTVAIKPLA